MRLACALAFVTATQIQAAEPARFDTIVRRDIFAGFNGDDKALARGIKKCEAALKKNAKNAEAMVWLGAAHAFQAGQAFQAKNAERGMSLWGRGLKEMDDAVKLDPNNPGVRIPRAAVLLPASRTAPPFIAKPLLRKALDDFETIYKLQKKDLDKLGTHPRGELRMGLADVYRRLGKAGESEQQLQAVVKELPDSAYAKRAKRWLAAEPTAKLVHNCIGCHRD